ncbi:MAG: ABC transporter permease [Acidobacteria bacterium]|nr:ABC transporter permease [Acidobacteriota bacterium]
MIKKIPIWRRYDRILGADPKADIRAELRFHLDSKVEELMAQGWSLDDARKEAERQFGDIRAVQRTGEQIGEHMESRRRFKKYAAECVQDIRHTLRILRSNPAFTTVSILVLALGVGLNSAVFTVVNTMLLRPLPFPDSNRLVWFTGGKSFDAKIRAGGGLSAETYTVDVYREFQRNNRSFQSVLAFQTFYNSLQYKLTGVREPRQLDAVEVSDNFFPTLGVTPVLGRNFTAEEVVKGGRPAAILSYYFWKTEFAADPSIIGRSITINTSPSAVNGSVTIVGVLPATFDFGAVFAPGKKVDLFVPAVMDFWSTWGNTLAVVGRLKQGITVAQAQDEADRLFPSLKSQHKDWYYDYASDLFSLKAHVEGSLQRSLVVLWCAVGLILLIVCVNLSNLQLGRAAARSKEFAMRRALGASRGRIIRQLLTESLVISFAGSVVGLAMAFAILVYLSHQTSIALPLLTTIRLDFTSISWTLVTAIVVGILFGLAPAYRMSRSNIHGAIKENTAGTAGGRGQDRFRSILVISEISLACLLLVGAGLLLRSFLRILDVDLGFNPSHAAAIQTDLPPAANKDELLHRTATLKAEIDRVGALPGVEAVGIADMLPLDRNREWGLQSVGRYHAKGADTGALVYLVTPGYLRAMGMRLRAGRDFSWSDTPDTQPVIVINEAAAKREWPGEDALGKLAYATGKTPDRVIGVIADVRERGLEQNASPQIYIPMTQNSDVEGATLVVRSRIDTDTLGGGVLSALRSLNPAQPATELRPLQTFVDHSVSPRRFFVLLVTIFAGLGISLAALGIYGVISYSVTQKTQEIGVRMALGATRGLVQRAILGQTLRLAIGGLAVGFIASLGAARLIRSLLYATSPWDPFAYLVMAILLLAISLLSGYVPARRASRIEPMRALRGN